jgi:hypothetical protein
VLSILIRVFTQMAAFFVFGVCKAVRVPMAHVATCSKNELLDERRDSHVTTVLHVITAAVTLLVLADLSKRIKAFFFGSRQVLITDERFELEK